MKLLSFDAGSGPRAGVLTDEGVVDIGQLLGIDGRLRDVQDLLLLSDPVERIAESLARTSAIPAWRPDQLRLLPPVLRPPTIRDHIAFEEHATRQFTRAVPDVWRRRPLHYYSNPSRLVGDHATVTMPETERLDYELELAAVIGVEVSDVSEQSGLNCILGFTILNDWTARDLQADEMEYGLGPAKGKDFATSLGPWVVTTDEIQAAIRDGALDLRCRVRVNGATWADSNSISQYHSWGKMVEHASQDSVLLPGDVIASGTVGGCSIGEAIRKGRPARYLLPGDMVELEVDRLGTLTNTIIANPRVSPARYRAAKLPEMPTPLMRDTS